MPKYTEAPDGSVWQSLGGSSRNFKNVANGETLSRRQFDKRFGALARGGFSSYETKAKASPEEIRLSRPAIGRGSTSRKGKGSIRGLRPLTNKKSRTVIVQYDEDSYREAVTDATRNSKIIAVAILANLVTENHSTITPTLVRLTSPDSLPSFEEIEDKVEDISQAGSGVGAEIENLIFHIQFFDNTIKVSKRKNEIAEKKRLAKQAASKAKQRASRKK